MACLLQPTSVVQVGVWSHGGFHILLDLKRVWPASSRRPDLSCTPPQFYHERKEQGLKLNSRLKSHLTVDRLNDTVATINRDANCILPRPYHHRVHWLPESSIIIIYSKTY